MAAVVHDTEAETHGGQALFEMANLRPERTGLPFVTFVSQKGGARHEMRIKLARSPRERASEMITVALCPTPRIVRGHLNQREFELVRRWLELNADALIGYWNGAIEYTEDVMAMLKPLSETHRA